MNDPIAAVGVLIGQFDIDWINVEVDEVEWTQPRYNHQN